MLSLRTVYPAVVPCPPFEYNNCSVIVGCSMCTTYVFNTSTTVSSSSSSQQFLRRAWYRHLLHIRQLQQELYDHASTIHVQCAMRSVTTVGRRTVLPYSLCYYQLITWEFETWKLGFLFCSNGWHFRENFSKPPKSGFLGFETSKLWFLAVSIRFFFNPSFQGRITD